MGIFHQIYFIEKPNKKTKKKTDSVNGEILLRAQLQIIRLRKKSSSSVEIIKRRKKNKSKIRFGICFIENDINSTYSLSIHDNNYNNK